MIISAAAQAKSQQQKGEYDSAVGRYNARVMENKATQTANKGVLEENVSRQKTAELIARQRAQLGAAGVNIESGTSSALISDTKTLGAADAYRIKSNYGFAVTGMQQQAGLIQNQGEAYRSLGRTQAVGTLISGISSGISGSGIADKWYKPNSAATTTPTIH